MDIDNKKGQVDLDKYFPDEFSVSFHNLKRNFYLKFSKLKESDKLHPAQNADIYVIDKSTAKPVKYDLKNEEVYANYLFLFNNFAYFGLQFFLSITRC